MRNLHFDVSPGAWISVSRSSKILNLCYLSISNIHAVGSDCTPHIICRTQEGLVSPIKSSFDWRLNCRASWPLACRVGHLSFWHIRVLTCNIPYSMICENIKASEGASPRHIAGARRLLDRKFWGQRGSSCFNFCRQRVRVSSPLGECSPIAHRI